MPLLYPKQKAEQLTLAFLADYLREQQPTLILRLKSFCGRLPDAEEERILMEKSKVLGKSIIFDSNNHKEVLQLQRKNGQLSVHEIFESSAETITLPPYIDAFRKQFNYLIEHA